MSLVSTASCVSVSSDIISGTRSASPRPRSSQLMHRQPPADTALSSSSATLGTGAGRELVRHGPKMLAPSVDGKRLAPVGLDGMYGRIAVPFESYRGVVLVCGGIGCTPMFVVLMHMAETSSELVGRMVTLVWTFRELELLPAFARELRAARALGWDIRLHHTTMSSPDTEPGGDDWYRNEHGYCCLQQSLPDQFPQDIAEQIRPGRPRLVEIYSKFGHRLLASSDGVGQPACTVLACGPMGLVQSAKLACRQDTVAVHFEFHSEEFEW